MVARGDRRVVWEDTGPDDRRPNGLGSTTYAACRPHGDRVGGRALPGDRRRPAGRFDASVGPSLVRRLHGPLRAARHVHARGRRVAGFNGSWKADGGQIELLVPKGIDGCDGPGRYRFRVEDRRVTFDLVSDDCEPRRMILDRSTWAPAGEARVIPVRRITRTVADRFAAAAAGRRWRGQLAVVPRTVRLGHRGEAGPARHVERQDGRAHPLAHADSRSRPLEPHRLGRSHVRHQRHQQPAERDVPSRPVRRRRCLGRSVAPTLGGLRDRQAHGEDAVGARRRTKANR